MNLNLGIEQLAANFTVVEVGDVRVWFSYTTPIAFRKVGQPLVVRENTWGPTTGKHLNRVDGGSGEAKARRVSSEEFAAKWRELGL